MNTWWTIGLLLQIQLPQPVGYVNDFARLLTPAAASRVQRVVDDVRASSGGEIVVVTMSDLGGREDADVAREIGRQWKVGARGEIGARARNAGTIILVVPKESSRDGRGHLRIEVGSGAEGFLTDATTGAIEDEAISLFRAGDYGGGIELMTTRVAERYAREFGFALDSSARPPPRRAQRSPAPTGGGPPITVWIFVVLMILSALSRGRRRRGCVPIILPIGGGWGGGHRGGGGWGGGGFGGGGFGGFGGGGGFSGGGSGRSW